MGNALCPLTLPRSFASREGLTGFFFVFSFLLAIKDLPQERETESQSDWFHRVHGSQSVERFGIQHAEGSWPSQRDNRSRPHTRRESLGVRASFHPDNSIPDGGGSVKDIKPRKPQPTSHPRERADRESRHDPIQSPALPEREDQREGSLRLYALESLLPLGIPSRFF